MTVAEMIGELQALGKPGLKLFGVDLRSGDTTTVSSIGVETAEGYNAGALIEEEGNEVVTVRLDH